MKNVNPPRKLLLILIELIQKRDLEEAENEAIKLISEYRDSS